MPNSWDLFDTLVAGRDVKVAAGNQTTQFPIIENVLKVQPDDIIVSDHEYFDKALARVRELGLQNDVIVTPNGKWEGTVWPTLPFKPVQHTGDSVRADVDSANRFGIRGVLSSLHKLTDSEQFIYDRVPHLGLLCREARLRTFGEYRGIELMQVDYNFPALVCASIILNRRFPNNTLLMSGRDCYMWQKLMQRMFQRGIFWLTSCYARMNADENYHRYIRSFENPLLVDLCGSGRSFSYLPEYKSFLLFTPSRSQWNIPAIWRGPDVWRLEQANRAPMMKFKQMGDLGPIFFERRIPDIENEPHIKAQCGAFFFAMSLFENYDLEKIKRTSDQDCLDIIKYLLPHYIDFVNDVEPLRRIDIIEDAE